MRTTDLFGREIKSKIAAASLAQPTAAEDGSRAISSRSRREVKTRIEHGDCLEVMRRLIDEGVTCESCVTDPPYHLTATLKRFGKIDITDDSKTSQRLRQKLDGAARLAHGFLNQQWDGGDIAFRPETWQLVYQLLKPGAFLLAFGGTRTYHRLTCAIEDAGFVIQDCVMWLYGSGFPKRRDMLKPAYEPIVMAYKPGGERELRIDECRIGTIPGIRGNKYGAGEYKPNSPSTKQVFLGRFPANICHDGSDEVVDLLPQNSPGSKYVSDAVGESIYRLGRGKYQKQGPIYADDGSAARFFYSAKADADDRVYRDIEEVTVEWISEKGQHQVTLQVDTAQLPKKVIVVSPLTVSNEWSTFLSGNITKEIFQKGSKFITSTTTSSTTESKIWSLLMRSLTSVSTQAVSYETENSGSLAESVGRYPSLTIILKNTVSFPGATGASRAVSGTPLKISVSGKRRHGHPTVKPTSLMQWLVRLVTPYDGTVLDPFAGTGSTGAAAVLEGLDSLLIERDDIYIQDIRRKIDLAHKRRVRTLY